MAKIKNPLMSISAAGTIGKTIAFRATKSGSVAAMKPHCYCQQSPNELLNQQVMKNARAAFLTLDTADKADWKKLEIARLMPSWNLFFTEYQTQQITPPNMPLIPEPFL